jgi:hypothetical protein
MIPLRNKPQDIKFKRILSQVSAPQSWETVDPSMEGYCYLCLYREKDHQKVAQILGMYPYWRDVKLLGGFKTGGVYHTTRTSECSVHIGTEGTGYSVANLQIRDNDSLGSINGLRTSVMKPTIVWRLAPLVWAIWSIAPNTYSGLTFWGLVGCTIAAIYPAWVIELAFGRLHLPSLDALSAEGTKDVRAALSQKPFGQTRFIKSVAILGLVSMPQPAYGRLTTKPNTTLNNFNFTPEVVEVVSKVHPQYLETHTISLPDYAICTTRQSLRLQILDLDVDDEDLLTYITGMCPQLNGKAGWREAAEALALANAGNDLGARTNRLLEYGLDLWAEVSTAATKVVVATADSVTAAMHDSGDVYVGALGDSRTLIKDAAEAGLKLARVARAVASTALGNLTLALEGHQTLPGVMVTDIFAVLDRMGEAFKPIEGLEYISKRITETAEIIANNTMGYNNTVESIVKALALVAEDMADLANESYEQSKAITTTNYQYMKDNEGSVRQAIDNLTVDTRDIGKEFYLTLKQVLEELKPLEQTKDVANTVADVARIAGGAVGGIVVGALAETSRLLPTSTQLIVGRKAILGEPVTSTERVEVARARSKWTIGTWLWAPTHHYTAPFTCGLDEAEKTDTNKKGKGK